MWKIYFAEKIRFFKNRIIKKLSIYFQRKLEKCTVRKFYATFFRGFFDPGQILSLGSYLVPLGLELICYAQHTNIHGNLNDLIRATFKAF